MSMDLSTSRPGPVVVGIAGGSGSGKTTLAQAVLRSLGSELVTYICHDAYYRPLDHLPAEERAQTNFDHPDSLQTSLLVSHLQQLRNGQAVEIPTYDFKTHTRLPSTTRAEPKAVILVEGILIFADAALRDSIDMRIFVDTRSDLRFIRRLQRDMRERGRQVDDVVKQYLETVRPMHDEWVEPSKEYSHMVVPTGLNDVALHLVVSGLRSAITRTAQS